MATSFAKRLQLQPPAVAVPPHAPDVDALPVPGKEAGKSKWLEPGGISPPSLVSQHRLPGSAGATRDEPSEEEDGCCVVVLQGGCAVGCTRDAHHVGYCVTVDGLAPPNVKKRHAQHKEHAPPAEVQPTPPKLARFS